MKVTSRQIKEALTNQMQINNADEQSIYDCIREQAGAAIDMAGIRKSQEYFTKADWRSVYKNIKKILEDMNN